ncbi:polyamine aminopropyltransferase [Desulfosarcina sp. BuS5]|uniref:polyamine aminopropyltransferase n=1 Tax=Desulfosarcina sp. BuS5 TaxID=933262 RepID=UPI000A0634BA|nr:polyamine aminopropyltransferase [Desulfosarcina sp. BuS5]
MNINSMVKSDLSFGRAAIYIITFLMGGCGIAYEYTFSKIASDLLGNSVQQWAVIIGLMMFCMGIGSDIQKYIKDKHIFDSFIFFEIILSLIGGFGPIFLLFVFGAGRDYFALAQYGLSTVTGILIGLEIPVLARINERYTPQLRLNIGGILRMDYIGAFLGALSWIFVLTRFFTIIQTGFIIGIINNIVAGIALLYFVKNASKKFILAGSAIVSVVALGYGFCNAPAWTACAEQRLFLDPIVYSKTTVYQHIVLTQHFSGDIACYINGHLQFHSNDEYIYHEFLVHPAMHAAQKRKRILVLGGGDGLAVREILKYKEVRSITLVDIDPEMTDIAINNPYLASLNQGSLQHAKVSVIKNRAIKSGKKKEVPIQNRARPLLQEFTPGPEISIINMDAAKFIEQAPGLFDVIIIDFPDPNSLELSKLYSKGFYEKIYNKLSRNGIFVQQSSSPFFTQKAFICIGKTIKSAKFSTVPIHENVPSFGEWGWWLGCKKDFMSENRLKHALQSIDSLFVETQYLTPQLIKASLSFGKNIHFNNADIKINTMLNNVIYKYYIQELKENE